VAEIWTEERHELVGIGTGYSLSDDGLWRQHSWGLRREGILETTVPRVKYFGVLLQHADADSFAMANLTSACMSCASVGGKTKGSRRSRPLCSATSLPQTSLAQRSDRKVLPRR
jgi:hypothetical protein